MHRWREQGSLPLVLLVAIVVGGIVIALFGYVRSGQRTARTNIEFTQAIQVADAGAQAAVLALSTSPPQAGINRVCGSGSLDEVAVEASAPWADCDSSPVDAGPDPAAGAGGWHYTWEARRSGSGHWEIRSTGRLHDGVRIVELSVGAGRLFPTMLFANDPGNDTPDIAGGGSFGVYDSNASVILDGALLQVGSNDRLLEISAQQQTNTELSCFGAGACETNERRDLENLAAQAFNEGGVCHGREIAPLAVDAGTTKELDGNQVHCYSQVVVERAAQGNQRTRVEVVNPPVVVFVGTGGVRVEGAGQNAATLINVDSSQVPGPGGFNRQPVATQPLPEATNLQFYVAGGPVDFNNNFLAMAATLYAPNSPCDFGAQATMFGAAVCREINAEGGMFFWYDSAADDLDGGGWDQQGYSEQFQTTSNFTWAGS